jgi:hypothetical protein
VAESEDGKIIGFHGAYPVRLKVGGKEIITFEVGDLMVAEEVRRRGIGKSLCMAYHESEEVLTTACDYAVATGKFYRQLGLQPVHCLPTRVRLLNLESTFDFLVKSGRIPSTILVSIACITMNPILAFLNFVTMPKKSKEFTIEEVEKVGPAFDLLWEEISPGFPIIVVRDARFVKWRFLDDPVFKHKLLSAHDRYGKLKGYVDICIVRKRGVPIGRIMDLFCSPRSTEIIDSLLAEAIRLFKEEGVSIVSCRALNRLIRDRISRCLYFEPRSLKEPLLVYWKGDPELKAFVHDADNWHLTHADGDEGFRG